MKTISSVLLLSLTSLLAPHSGHAQVFYEALGADVLKSNTTGSCNAALGDYTLFANAAGNSNTACGAGALFFRKISRSWAGKSQ